MYVQWTSSHDHVYRGIMHVQAQLRLDFDLTYLNNISRDKSLYVSALPAPPPPLPGLG